MENKNLDHGMLAAVQPGFSDDNYKSKPKKVDDRIKNIKDSGPIETFNDNKVIAPPNSRQQSNAFSFRMNKKEYGSPNIGKKRNRFDIDQEDNLSEESSSHKLNSQESPNFKSRKLDDPEAQQSLLAGKTTKDRVKIMSN